MEKASLFILNWCRSQGVKGLTIDMYEEEGRTPVVFGQIEASEGVDCSMLMYGHIDKQPHLDGAWDEGLSATNPVRRGDRIYGRGASDDGYAPFASLSIIKLLQEQGLKHPKVILFFENDEESGSFDIGFWIDKLADKIGTPEMFVCLDSGCFDYDHWYVTSTLRGAANFSISCEIMNSGVHSGSGGGVIPDTFRILRILLDRIQDSNTGKVCDDLHSKIPGKVYMDCENVVKTIGDSFIKSYGILEGSEAMNKDPFECYLNRSQRPTLTVIGVDGIPDTANGGNVIRPKTVLKCSCRLPPYLTVNEAKSAIEKKLTTNVPYNAKID